MIFVIISFCQIFLRKFFYYTIRVQHFFVSIIVFFTCIIFRLEHEVFIYCMLFIFVYFLTLHWVIILKNWKNKNRICLKNSISHLRLTLIVFRFKTKTSPSRIEWTIWFVFVVFWININKLLWLFSNYVELKIRSSSQQPPGIYVKYDRLQPWIEPVT